MEVVLSYDELLDNCLVDLNENAAIVMSLQVDNFRKFWYFAGLVRKLGSAYTIRALSPVTIQVTDQYGNVLNSTINEIPYASYAKVDSDFDGIFEEIIIISLDSPGDLLIEIFPDSTA